MVKVRLARSGATKRPFYHIVATESRSQRDGRFIERLGFYNPVARGGDPELKIDLERIKYWTVRGARVSERVAHLAKLSSREQAVVSTEVGAKV